MGCKAACSCTAAGVRLKQLYEINNWMCGRVSAEPSGLRSADLLGGLFLVQLNIRQHIFIQTDSLEVCFFLLCVCWWWWGCLTLSLIWETNDLCLNLKSVLICVRCPWPYFVLAAADTII